MKREQRTIKDILRDDVKTLNDISAMLERDGRFAALPKVLQMIAADITRSITRKLPE